MTKKKKNTLVGDVAKVASGTAVAQILTVLLSPVIARLFSPDAFGILGLFLSVVGVISANSTFRYHMAIILPEDDKDASAIGGLSFLSTFIVSILAGVFIFVFKGHLEKWFEVSVDTTLLIIIPVAIMLDASNMIFRQWHIRKKSYGTAATSDATKSIGISAAQLGFGFSGLVGGIFLVFSSLSGIVVAFITYLKGLPEKRVFFSSQMFSLKRIKTQAKEHKKFLQFSTLGGVVNKLAWELPIFMLTGLFNTSIAGYYVMGHRLLRLPVSMIGTAIGEVYFERGAKAHKQGTLHEITELVQKRLVQVGFFPFFVLSFIGTDLFIVFFGENWATAGLYSQVLALWTFVWFMASPNSNVYSITNNQDKMLNMQIFLFVLRFIGLGTGALMGSALLAITFFGLAGIIGYGFLLVQISRIAGVSPTIIIKEIFAVWPACIAFTVVISSAFYFDLNSIWITITGIIAVLIYYPYMLFKEPELRVMFKRIL